VAREHLADGGVLAADAVEVPETDAVEGQDVFGQRSLPVHFGRRIVHDFTAWDTAGREGEAMEG
jgi:hypothetical protein